jgi:hypothetical protein
MRFGYSAGEIVGITLKTKALKIWALSSHICCKQESDMREMEEEASEATRVQLYHKEEAKARVRENINDRLVFVGNLKSAWIQ